LVLRAARIEGIKNIDLKAAGDRIGSRIITPVREAKFVNHVCTQNRGLPYLVLGILSVPRPCALRQDKAADSLVVVVNVLIIEIENDRVIGSQRPLTSQISGPVRRGHYHRVRKLSGWQNRSNRIA